jgi:hypothetical protein
MNKCYRLIWNERTCTWVAAAEIARARGKRLSGALPMAAGRRQEKQLSSDCGLEAAARA